jgi:type I restriction enzyme M protein
MASCSKATTVNLDIFWLMMSRWRSPPTANLPAPEVIAAEIAEDLQAALEQFATIAAGSEEVTRTGL